MNDTAAMLAKATTTAKVRKRSLVMAASLNACQWFFERVLLWMPFKSSAADLCVSCTFIVETFDALWPV